MLPFFVFFCIYFFTHFFFNHDNDEYEYGDDVEQFPSSVQQAEMPPGQRLGGSGPAGELCRGKPRSYSHHHQGNRPNMDQRELLEERPREV